jgi:hypothetical protein
VKGSVRSQSKSLDKEVSSTSATKEGIDCGHDDTKTKDKEHNSSGRSRENLRVQRNSRRLSKSPQRLDGDEESSPKLKVKERPVRTASHPRRQSSSRRLMAQIEASGTRLAAQKSVLSLYRDDGSAEEEICHTDLIDDHEKGVIVSHSRMQRPSSRRSSLAKTLSVTQLATSPDGEHRRRPVGKSLSMNQKLDNPSETHRAPPQRVKSAIVQRPRSLRGTIEALEEHPNEDAEDILTSPRRPVKGNHLLPPARTKSTGAISVRERRLMQKLKMQGDDQEDVKPTAPSRLSSRRLSSQDGDVGRSREE